MNDSSPPVASCDDVKRFVATSGMTKVEMERLLGSPGQSKGKNLRRWELYGAPAIASILLAYIARYGWDVARKIADEGVIDLSEQA